MELAKTIGTVRPGKGRFIIEICVNGERYKLRHLPVVSGGWLPFRDEETASEVLGGIIRVRIGDGASVESAIAPYLKGGGDKFNVRAAYKRFIAQKQRLADAGEIRQERVRDHQDHLDRGWLSERESVSIHEINFSRLESLKNSLAARGLAPGSVGFRPNDFQTGLRVSRSGGVGARSRRDLVPSGWHSTRPPGSQFATRANPSVDFGATRRTIVLLDAGQESPPIFWGGQPDLADQESMAIVTEEGSILRAVCETLVSFRSRYAYII